MANVLIGAGVLRDRPGDFRDELLAAGFGLIEPDGPDILTGPLLVEALADADAVLAGGELYPPEIIRSAPKLRVIARVGVGYDAVDVDACTERDILLTITPGTNEGSVAEQAFALMLGVARDVALHDRAIRAGGWNRYPVRPLRGRVLGLVGLGRTGRAVATRARAFGMTVIAFDPLDPGEFETTHTIERCSFEEVLERSDIVSLHLPLVPATDRIIGAAVLGRMQPGSVLINTSRGGVVDEEALVEALRSGHLGGAGLDVLREEPPPDDHPLFSFPNVVFSPHIGGIDNTAIDDMARMAARCVIKLARGEWPAECVINRDLAGAWRW